MQHNLSFKITEDTTISAKVVDHADITLVHPHEGGDQIGTIRGAIYPILNRSAKYLVEYNSDAYTTDYWILNGTVVGPDSDIAYVHPDTKELTILEVGSAPYTLEAVAKVLICTLHYVVPAGTTINLVELDNGGNPVQMLSSGSEVLFGTDVGFFAWSDTETKIRQWVGVVPPTNVSESGFTSVYTAPPPAPDFDYDTGLYFKLAIHSNLNITLDTVLGYTLPVEQPVDGGVILELQSSGEPWLRSHYVEGDIVHVRYSPAAFWILDGWVIEGPGALVDDTDPFLVVSTIDPNGVGLPTRIAVDAHFEVPVTIENTNNDGSLVVGDTTLDSRYDSATYIYQFLSESRQFVRWEVIGTTVPTNSVEEVDGTHKLTLEAPFPQNPLTVKLVTADRPVVILTSIAPEVGTLTVSDPGPYLIGQSITATFTPNLDGIYEFLNWNIPTDDSHLATDLSTEIVLTRNDVPYNISVDVQEEKIQLVVGPDMYAGVEDNVATVNLRVDPDIPEETTLSLPTELEASNISLYKDTGGGNYTLLPSDTASNPDLVVVRHDNLRVRYTSGTTGQSWKFVVTYGDLTTEDFGTTESSAGIYQVDILDLTKDIIAINPEQL
jgi:hypothetical protein